MSSPTARPAIPEGARPRVGKARDTGRHPAAPPSTETPAPAAPPPPVPTATSSPIPAAAPSRKAVRVSHVSYLTADVKDRLARYVFDHRGDDPKPVEWRITDQAVDEWLKARGA